MSLAMCKINKRNLTIDQMLKKITVGRKEQGGFCQTEFKKKHMAKY